MFVMRREGRLLLQIVVWWLFVKIILLLRLLAASIVMLTTKSITFPTSAAIIPSTSPASPSLIAVGPVAS